MTVGSFGVAIPRTSPKERTLRLALRRRWRSDGLSDLEVLGRYFGGVTKGLSSLAVARRNVWIIVETFRSGFGAAANRER